MPGGTWEEQGPALLRRRPGAPTLELRVVDGRLRVGAVLLEGRRSTDLSRQPGAVRALLLDRTPGSEPDDVAAFARGAAELLDRHGLWTPGDGDPSDLATVLLGGAFPLAAQAFARGAGPVDEVPPWAVDVLRARTARGGARAAFGDRATRAVVAALAASLVGPVDEGAGPTPPRPIALAPLALARMGGEVLDADRIAAVLLAPGPYRPPDRWPTNEEVTTVAGAARSFGPQRTRQVLLDAARLPDGIERLVAMSRLWHDVRDHLQGRLPMGLVDLDELCRSHSPHDPVARPPVLVGRTRPFPVPATPAAPPAPARAPAPPRPAAPPARRPSARPAVTPAGGAPHADPPVAAHHRALRAPAAHAGQALHPADAARAVDGLRVGQLTLRVARTDAELDRWSRVLRNCLDGYGPAVRARRSIVIAVERDHRVVAALEVAPSRTIRQFHGPANRPPPPALERAVVDALLAHHVIDRRPTG